MNFKLKWHDIIIYVILLLVGGVILALPTFPSMDGAAHLYNAHVVRDLVVFGDSSPYHTFFNLNSIPVPNWLDHLALGLLMFIFKPILAQKVFLVISVFAFVFVYNKVGKKNNSLFTVAILPMVFSFFFFTGLYNQHWSYIVLIAYLWFLSNSEFKLQDNKKFYVIVFAFSFFFWLTSILGFAVFLIVTGLLCVVSTDNDTFKIRFNWKQIGILTVVILPTIVLTFLFVLSTPMTNAEPDLSLWNRFLGLFHLDLIRLYNMGGETYFLGGIGFIYTVLLLILGKELLKLKKHALLVLIIVLFIVAVLVPNQAGAGMLSTRLAMYFWVVVLVLVKHFIKLNKLLYVAVGIVFVSFFFINNKKYNTHIERLGNLGYEVYKMGENIGPSETVIGLNETNDWYIGHLLDYACLPNKSINVSNYEANYPWFPVQWSSDNEQSQKFDRLWKEGKKNEILDMRIDWVLVYGALSPQTEKQVKDNYVLHSTIEQVQLFKLKN